MGAQEAPLAPRMPGKPRVSKQMVLAGSSVFCEHFVPQCEAPHAQGLLSHLLGAQELERGGHGLEGKSGTWGAAWRGPYGSHRTRVSLSLSPPIAFLLPQSPSPGTV